MQGVALWQFVGQPWPRYWTAFDLVSNVLGYVPFGFFVALVVLRWRTQAWAVTTAVAAAAMLSFALESVQMLLPLRVPSNLDWGLNVLGAGLGALAARALMAWGALVRWVRWRERWFEPHSSGERVLWVLWPVALLFPSAVPFGLGQVRERLEAVVVRLLADAPWQEWLPVRHVELQPLWPAAALLCVVLGLLLPCLLVFAVVRTRAQRAVMALVGIAIGVLANSLSAALSYGPVHAWAWMGPSVWLALGVALAASVALLWLPARWCVPLGLGCLLVHLGVLNQASANVYFAQTLQHWEQGQFIRFYGLAQWLGWLWPYALLWHWLKRVWTRPHSGAPR